MNQIKMKFYWRYVIAFLLLLLPLVALGNDWGTKRMTVGEEIYLETSDATYSTLHNSQVSVTEAYWSSSSSCVRVRSDRGIEGCVIYGYSTGTATVTFKCYYIVGGYRSDSMTHTYTVVVNENSEVKVTSISLNTTSATMYTDDTEQLSATVYPSNATNKSVSWSSSNNSVATVSSSGLVTAKAVGSATITCKANGGSNITASCSITVKSSTYYVTSISLNANPTTLYIGDSKQFSANVYPSYATNQSVSWSSSNTSVATISSSGLVTAKAEGTTTITCKANDGSGVKASLSLTVSKFIYITTISLNSSTESLDVGATKQLSAEVYPSDATNKSVTWSSSNTNVATVSSTGLVTAIAEGTATITCKANDGSGVKATCKVTVNKVYVTSISLNQSSRALTVHEVIYLWAEVYPNNATDKSLSWSSSNNNVATVSSNGQECYVNAIAEGIATITCIANDGSGVKAICEVTVSTVSVTSISLNTSTAALYVGDTKQLSATVNPSTATDKSVTWSSSNTNVATVSSTGLVTAIAEGTATITCKANDGSGVEATCNVTVSEPVKVASISLDPNNVKMLVNDMIQLEATVYPYNVKDRRLSWSSNNNSVATVSSTGMVTAIASGTATITCTAQDGSGVTSSCKITVIEPQPPLHRNIKSVSAGEECTMMLMTDGTLWACGKNDHGKLGDGTTTDRPTPVQVMTDVAQVSAGYSHTMIMKTDGTLWACGYNYYGQLGDGTTTDRTTPVQVMTDVAQVSAGEEYHTVILKTDGTLWACGYNYYGQLGDGTNIDRHTPVQVMTDVAQVSAGSFYTMILKTDGTLWACGNNDHGKLGDGTTTDRPTPVQVMTDVAQVSAGLLHTMILKTDGTLWACGSNYYGWLGDGTTTDRTTPVQVMTDVAQVSTGANHTMILKTNGTLWACGDNYYGELGDGTNIIERHTPVQVMTDVAQVSAGRLHTMILKTDGALWACGSNFYGQLGDGTNIGRITPVNTMIGDTDVSKINNVIYARRATNCAGGQSTLSINMKNSVVAESFQFDLYLPDGVSFVMDEDGFPEAYLSTERTTARKTNMFESTLQSDGSLRVYAASSNGSTFSGNDGEVATVNVKISDSMEAGEYFMFLKNIVITDNNAITYEVDSVRTTLEVLPYALGDANMDGKVNVGDLTAIAHHVMGNTPDNFNQWAADANGDGKINVGDLTAVAHLILYGTINKPSMVPRQRLLYRMEPQDAE